MRLCIVTVLFLSVCKSEVVDVSFSLCNSFFYKNTPPTGFSGYRFSGLSAICQLYMSSYHFATLYSTTYRVPLYSAYTLDQFTCFTRQPTRRRKWFIEPQLSSRTYPSAMTTEGSETNTHKTVQAVNIDYPNTNFDRGHLNPSFYQCDDTRTATFTLTNAVPQDPCFNQQIWKQMEEMSKNIMREKCSFVGARRFFVTGVVPSGKKIPNSQLDEEGDESRQTDRVSVPYGMWTAACCDSSNAISSEDRKKGFSFGYYGENIPDSYVSPYSVTDLGNELARLYGVTEVNIFADSCYSSSENSIYAFTRIAVPVERKIAQTLHDMSISHESTIDQNKKSFLQNFENNLKSNDDFANRNWKFADADVAVIDSRGNIQSTRDMLASSAMVPLLMYASSHKVSKRSVDGETSQSGDEYIIVPSKQSDLTASGTRCRQGHACDYHSKSYQWCYTDWSNNWDYCCTDNCRFEKTSYSWCYTSYAKHWAYCSQRSSMVTVTGIRCRADHECGHHGKSYHWCYIDTNKNWKYCCQPSHTCDKHKNTSYKWCYVGYKKNTSWQYCNY